MRRLGSLTLGLLALTGALTLSPPVAADGPVVSDYLIVVDGEPADGLLATPAGAPTAVVVFGHGLGHTTESWRHHLAEAASRGAVAVAMNYSPYFDLDRSAAESLAAAEDLHAKHPGVPVLMLGVSMGAAVTGMTLAESRGLFDYWVDVEGVSNLYETYAEAAAVGHPVKGYIEDETGGTPADVPLAYAARSPALLGADIKASGVKGVVLVHPLNDGLVPYNQGREMAAALAAEGIPYDFHTVLRGPCSETQQTTGTGALFGRFTDRHNPLCLAGHGTESSSTQVVIRTGLDALFALMDGSRVPTGADEFVVDRPGP